MSTTDELSDAEIDHRYNHWEENDMERCKHCGSFVSPPEFTDGRRYYQCKACEQYNLDVES